jgi:hypothetical protein
MLFWVRRTSGYIFFWGSLTIFSILSSCKSQAAIYWAFFSQYWQALRLFDSNAQGSFTVFHDEDLQPVILNRIPLSGAAIRAFFGPTKKIQYYGSKWIVNVN